MPSLSNTKADASFCTFSEADLAWLATTAERDTGLALELNKAGDDRGHMLYASPLDDRHGLFPWCILATQGGVTVEKVDAAPSYMDQVQGATGPAVTFLSLRDALASIAAEHHNGVALPA